MEFKKITVADKNKVEAFVKNNGDMSCENDFINLLVWQNVYGGTIAADERSLIVRTVYNGRAVYYIPFGDMEYGFDFIKDYNGGRLPVIRAQQGERFDRFRAAYGGYYDIKELEDGYDYLYLREDLALLHGKKYHAKRNHISAFSKQYDWRYEPVNESNLPEIKICAEKWYKENADRFTKEMQAERNGVKLIIDNYEKTGVIGGAVRADGEIVAFTFASLINEETVDIHIEKALADYAVAYTVINNQFSVSLGEKIKYINREDDLGLEGLKKAKMSYHPVMLVKKYICIPR